MSDPTRRTFLKTVLGGAAATALPGMAGCVPSVNPAPAVDVTPYIHGGEIVLAAGAYPELQSGGAITLVSPQLPSPLLLSRQGDEYSTVSATCTHVGCPLGYAQGRAVCPCHASTFDPVTGAVLNPPAVAPLTTFDTRFDQASGAVTIRFEAAPFPPIVDGAVTFAFADFPTLTQACTTLIGVPSNGSDPLLIQALADGSYSAVNPVCPHAGCTVGFACDAALFRCPCHDSTFNADGSLVKGPATRGLTAYPVTVTSDALVVQVA